VVTLNPGTRISLGSLRTQRSGPHLNSPDVYLELAVALAAAAATRDLIIPAPSRRGDHSVCCSLRNWRTSRWFW